MNHGTRSSTRQMWIAVLASGILLAVPLLATASANGSIECDGRTADSIEQSFTVLGSREYECTDLEVDATITIADGATLTLTNSSYAITDGGAIHIQNGGRLILDATPYDGDGIQVDDGGHLEHLLRLQVQVEAETLGDIQVRAWQKGAQGPFTGFTHDGNGVFSAQVPARTIEGPTETDHTPLRIIAGNTTTANQTSISAAPAAPGGVSVDIAVPVDLDDDAPTWGPDRNITTDTGNKYISETTARLSWEPATDAEAAHPHRAIDRYVVTHAFPDGTEETLQTGDVGPPAIHVQGLAAGTHTFLAIPIDLVGNPGSQSEEAQVVVDLIDPTMQVKVSPALPTGQAGWYDRAPTITVEAGDQGASGVSTTWYRLDDGQDWTQYKEPFSIQASANHLVEVKVSDRAGNQAIRNLNVPVDVAPPTITVQPKVAANADGWHAGPVAMTIQATDPTSGVASMERSIGTGTWSAFQDSVVVRQSGVNELHVRATDKAGNPSEAATTIVRIDGSPPLVSKASAAALDDGRVRMDWSSAPPLDLVSGISQVHLERAPPDGEVTHRIEVTANRSSHDIGPFPVGDHRFRISATDLADNQAEGDWVTVTVERSSAGITFDSVDSSVRGVIPLQFHPVGEFTPVEVRYYIDDALIASTKGGTTGIEWDTTDHADGEYEIRVVALDAQGETQESLHTVQVRNGYGVTLQDNAAPLSIAMVLALASAALGFYGLRQWRTWQQTHTQSSSRHAITKHAPSHTFFEAAKALHIAGMAFAVLAVTALLAMPAVFGSVVASPTGRVISILGVALVGLQVWSLLFRAMRERRLLNEPRLQRPLTGDLDFDGTNVGPAAEADAPVAFRHAGPSSEAAPKQRQRRGGHR